jgi:pimeloyl-ACP methyl ester carboxylesterase
MTPLVREQAAMLGPRKSLVGIVAQVVEPGRPEGAVTDVPAVVILNAGIIHRVGPNRMFVDLARLLAAAGHTVVRFDLSGIGDSEPRPDGLAPLAAALEDIREVLDSLQSTRQIQRFILVGLCSGADHAIVYAGQDPRVVGTVLIDPSIPRTGRYYLQHYRARMFRLRSWLNFTSGRHPFWSALRGCMSGRRLQQKAQHHPSDLQSPEVRAFIEQAYSRAVAAEVQLLAVFTADLEKQHNYREQLLDAFPRIPFGDLLSLQYFPNTDHTFTAETERGRLLGLIHGWLRARSALSPAVAPK